MNGKLIVIDSGSDGSGKATQTAKLYDRLVKEGYNVRKIDFPNYSSDSSALVKMYLRGDFGKDAESVDPYVASTFYAVDRYASYKTEWGEFYNNGGIILADRYVTSNMIHQASKLEGDKLEGYLEWLYDLEYNMYKIPKPDCVVFLDVPVDYSLELMKGRELKNGQDKDIHESNEDYLRKSYTNALHIANKYNWLKVECVKEGALRDITDINNEIYSKVRELL